jgi:hypothetical protein
MNRKLSITAFAVTITLLLLTTLYPVEANNGRVWTTDIFNQPTNVFNIGETVRIYWEGFDPPIKIQIWFGGHVVATYIARVGEGYWDYLPTEGVGEYEIRLPSKENPEETELIYKFRWGLFYVIPENMLGALGSILAFTAGFLIFTLEKRKHQFIRLN